VDRFFTNSDLAIINQ